MAKSTSANTRVCFQNAAKCCNSAPSPLLVAARGDKTCKVSKKELKPFNSYITNKLQALKTNNIINFNDQTSTKKLLDDAVR
jgi:hypothetical protein